MTAEKAFDIVKKNHPTERLNTCLDFGKFYTFSFIPINVSNPFDYFTGSIVEAVDKRSGRVYFYDLTSNYNAYERAKKVDIADVFNYNIKNIQR